VPASRQRFVADLHQSTVLTKVNPRFTTMTSPGCRIGGTEPRRNSAVTPEQG
jgi:hypothetical protein